MDTDLTGALTEDTEEATPPMVMAMDITDKSQVFVSQSLEFSR